MLYYASELSDNILQTPEGFIICRDVPITRVGMMEYDEREMPDVTAAENGIITVWRNVENVHDDDTLASFIGKPVTVNHPPDFLNPDNWGEYAVGIVLNVRKGAVDDIEVLLADLLIFEKSAIDIIVNKNKREVSSGYEATLVETDVEGTYIHREIRGNHVAIVTTGRCGAVCSINDNQFSEGIMADDKSLYEKFKKFMKQEDDKDKKPVVVKDCPAAKPPAAKPVAVVAAKDADGASPDIAAVLSEMMKLLVEINKKISGGGTADAPGGDEVDPEEVVADADGDMPPTETAPESDMPEELAAAEVTIQAVASADSAIDSDVLGRAEIINPGIRPAAGEKVSTFKMRAISGAVKRDPAAKKIVDGITSKVNDGNVDAVFNATAAILGSKRKAAARDATAVHEARDQAIKSLNSGGVKTIDDINEANKKHWGK